MSQLVLQPQQIDSVKNCWCKIHDNAKFYNDTFSSRLYSNLLINNPQISTMVFNNDDALIKLHSLLFGDLLDSVITYLDDSTLSDEFVDKFSKANIEFTNTLIRYIEQMGSSFVITFKQWLGPQQVTPELETSLIKVYCYIANFLLQNETSEISDIDSTFSEEEPLHIQKQISPESDVQSELPVTAKAAAAPAPAPVPAPARAPVPATDGPTLSFSLDKNDKYKGFRRSVDRNYTPNNEPVSIKIPEQYTKPTAKVSPSLSSRLSSPKSDFDPRRKTYRSEGTQSSNASIMTTTDTMVTAASEVSSVAEEEPVITPRSAKRDSAMQVPSLVKKLHDRESHYVEFSDSDEETNSTATSNFDPRKKRLGHKRNNSVDLDYKVPGSFGDDSKEPEPVVPERSTARSSEIKARHEAFDSNSFGLKGLAPIVESEYDDTASSRYESDDEHSSSRNSHSDGTDVVSSGASTLSLNDRRSSLSSGTEPMSSPSPDFKSQQHPHTRTSSGSSSISYMKPLSQPRAVSHASSLGNMNSKFSRSTSSLLSDYSSATGNRNRASMGFMRSSFVLKKEMEELGFNIPENVDTSNPTVAMVSVDAKMAPASTSRIQRPIKEEVDYPIQEKDNSFEYLNTFGGSDSTLSKISEERRSLSSPSVKEKKSFGSKLKSMFSKSKSQSPPAPTRLKKISAEPSVKGYSLNRVSTSGEIASRKYAPSVQSSQATSALGNPYESRNAGSMRGSISSGKKLREPLARPPKAGYGYSMRNHSMSDVASIGSNGSSVSGFSFFGAGNGLKKVSTRSSYTEGGRRSGNKYKVKSVPYNVFAKGV